MRLKMAIAYKRLLSPNIEIQSSLKAWGLLGDMLNAGMYVRSPETILQIIDKNARQERESADWESELEETAY